MSPSVMKGKKKPDKRLPLRLFATDRFPSRRHNIFSKPDILPFIQNVLKDTEELQYIKNSCFGKLFELPARQCPVSCKLIHAFLTRQLLCEDRHTLWSVFGSDPICFGLKEFGTITGLPCGEFPADYDTELADQSKANTDPDWIRLIGKKKFVTIADLRHRLETDKRMPARKKLQIALILIVDGVLIAHQQRTRPTLKYVKMVQDVDAFCQHPWGRESFLKTISCMKPPVDCEDPAGELVCLLTQTTYRLQGFPLALQLLAFQAVPQLQSIIPAPLDTLTISQLEEPHLPLHANISYTDILRVEAAQNLAVTSFIPIESQPHAGWGVWADVAVDDRVTYMQSLIANKHPFKKHLWPGGYRSCPILIYKPVKEEPVPQRPILKPRKTLKKPSSSRKQRRISNYFPRTASTSNTHDQILEMLSTVSTQVCKLREDQKALRHLIKRRKSRSHSGRTTFHTVISCQPKANLQSKGCQTNKIASTNEDPALGTECPTPMEEDQTHFNSPVISQYGAQQYGQTQHMSPVHSPPVHRTTEHNHSEPTDPDHTLPVHKNPEHREAEQKVTDLTLPLLNSPEHTTPQRRSPVPVSPSPTPPWLYTPESPPVIYKSTIYNAGDHPNSPPLHHLLNEGLEIFEPISPEPASLENPPRYDTSTRRDDQPPLHPVTPDTSPTKSSGFADHAATVNAFAATATSRRISIPKLNFDQSQEDIAAEDCTELSDSSPARPTPRHKPSEEELATEMFKCPEVPALTILPPLPQTLWELFSSTLETKKDVFHITPSKFDFSNKFLLDIAEPQKWLTTFHMEILMFMLAGRHRVLLEREKLAFTTPFLTSGIQEVWKRFKNIRRKDRFKWEKNLTDLVLKPGSKWMDDVVTIYTPMIWGDRHWVGLAINLDMGYVEIMDPLPSLYADKKVVTFMEGLLTTLPYLVKKVAKPQQTQFRGLKPFYWKRMKDIYTNDRGGDCGPVSIKFMELHAHGDPDPQMSGLTDIAVDDLRKQYAMDVYKTFVLPAYHAPPMF